MYACFNFCKLICISVLVVGFAYFLVIFHLFIYICILLLCTLTRAVYCNMLDSHFVLHNFVLFQINVLY